MPQEKEKCWYFNSGLCKHESKCKYLHFKEECNQNCKLKNSMKRLKCLFHMNNHIDQVVNVMFVEKVCI